MIQNTEILKLVNPKKENVRNDKDIVSQIISCSIDGEEFVVETKYDVVREWNEKYIEPTANNDFEVIEIADYTGIINCLDEQILNDEIIKKEMQKSLSRGEKFDFNARLQKEIDKLLYTIQGIDFTKINLKQAEIDNLIHMFDEKDFHQITLSNLTNKAIKDALEVLYADDYKKFKDKEYELVIERNSEQSVMDLKLISNNEIIHSGLVSKENWVDYHELAKLCNAVLKDLKLDDRLEIDFGDYQGGHCLTNRTFYDEEGYLADNDYEVIDNGLSTPEFSLETESDIDAVSLAYVDGRLHSSSFQEGEILKKEYNFFGVKTEDVIELINEEIQKAEEGEYDFVDCSALDSIDKEDSIQIELEYFWRSLNDGEHIINEKLEALKDKLTVCHRKGKDWYVVPKWTGQYFMRDEVAGYEVELMVQNKPTQEELQDIVKTLKNSRDAISEGYEFSIIQMLKDTGLEEVIIEKTKAMQDKFNTLNDIKLIENEVGNIIGHYSNSNDRKRINEAVLTYLEKQKENNIEPSESIKEVQEKLAEAKKENKLAEIADNINEILNTKEHNLKFKKK
ncbi:hypothetical protein ACMWEF_001762 [Campylobacter jejuni]|nr:hypothetical protein [Campylobacter jejuni]EGA8646536.1 hypothetical protein [Campylobacter jejuni]